jgi:hypothetical membrane protein
VIVFGFLREGYSHVSQPMSDLGKIGSSNMAGQNVNFILTGLLILAFSFGLYRGTGHGKVEQPETKYPISIRTSSRIFLAE